MSKHGKRYRTDMDTVDRNKEYPLGEAVETVCAFKKPKFDQSIEICMHLGIDTKQADQLIRGSLSLPHGIGATRRVVAFCPNDRTEACKAAGAVEAGAEELVKKIEGGWLEFDVAVATPDVMRVISKLGRVLGPRGLMPSPKSGTVTANVEEAVKEYAAGKVEFRNDSGGNIHAVIGKQSFDRKQLVENAETFIDTIKRMKPASAKGQFLKKMSISATMTPGLNIVID